MRILFFITLLTFGFQSVDAQTANINQKDAKGERHGVWQKRYTQSKQLRYEGQFEHGKEVGTFKFYCENCGAQPEVIKEFSATDGSASVKFFSKEGKLVSEGRMNGKKRIGEWLYYAKDAKSIIIREKYNNGQLDGQRITYYPDGFIMERHLYANGLQEGPSFHFSTKGVTLKKLLYSNGLLNGPAEYYDNSGTITKKGVYKDGAKFGTWTYYKEGRFLFEKNY